MVIVLVLLAFIVGVAIVMGGYTALAKLPAVLMQRRLGSRLQEISQPQEQEDAPAKLLVKVQHEGPLPAVDRVLGRTTQGSSLARWIDQSGMTLSLSGVLLIAFGLAGLFALIAGVVVRSTWALPVGAAIGFAIPFAFLSVKRTRRMRAFEEQFPEGLDLIARALKAGHAFATGLKMVADEMPEPVGPEFRKTFDEQNFGLPLKDALDNLTFRVPLLDVRFFATAVLIQRETGGNLSEILDNLSQVVRERFKVLRQVRVHTAHGRYTGWVLLALPAFLGVALLQINPEHMALLYKEPMGQKMLVTAVVMQTIGYLWIKRVIKIEV
jgi:tight adherence protein B